jgi:hypothetical protein
LRQVERLYGKYRAGAGYRDFGPALAWEKLGEVHGVQVSRETG